MESSNEKKFGLTSAQAEESRAKNGSNKLSEVQGETFFDKLKGNFGDPMIKILCVALAVNVIIYILGATGVLSNVDVEWYEPVGIAIAIALATLVSTFSEFRNENAFQKLQEEASRITCKIYRDNDIKEIPIDDIVVGDCILLQSGDKIPADGKIVDGDIKVDQSVLNGESKEASKIVTPENYSDEGEAMDFLNPYKVFRGSVVCSGNAVMEVTVVGDKSVYGQIAKELQQDDDRESPLKVKLADLAGGISKFGYIGGVAIAVAFMLRQMIQSGFSDYFAQGFAPVLADLLDAIILAVIIIVMAVPEGLPLMIALVSAMNMGKMLKDNVLVRKISGIETAGSLNILFSDKTGTITKGKLEVVTFIDGNMTEYNKAEEVKGDLSKIMSVAIHHNTTSIVTREEGKVKVVGGNATEKAVLAFAADVLPENVKVEKVTSIPFNSTNKYSATQVKGDYNCTLVKGAPEKILARCKFYFDEQGNKQPFKNSQAIDDKINELAGRAIRVLGLAVADEPLGEDSLPEGEWTLIGILGIRDEVRPESVTAIKEVHQAGVQVVMITGDRKDTAVAIAKEANLLTSESDVVLTSDELQKMSDDEIKKVLPDIRVIARALPTDKSRLVRLAQELELVVGMTGDGVNDSPALKKADVGFAMGGGTEVAKEASDIVILDDNFNSIDKAILYGRTIFNSIRKFIVFQLTINVAAVLISFISPLIGVNEPLTVIQILWVNLVMDTLAALAFGGEPALKRFMKEKPKKRSESIVSKNMWSAIITDSVWMVLLSLALMLAAPLQKIFIEDSGFNPSGFFNIPDFSNEMYIELGTAYFAFFIFASVFNAFNARTDKTNLFENINGNKGFLKILGLIAVVQIAMTYLGGAILRCHGLDLVEWIVILIMAISIIPVDLARKAVMKSK